MKIRWSGIPDDQFEEIIAALMRAMGYENVVVRTGGYDDGWDIDGQTVRSFPDGKSQIETWRVECKRYRGEPSAMKIRDHYQRMAKTPPIPAHLLFVTTYRLSNPTKKDLGDFAKADRVHVQWWEHQELELLLEKHMDYTPLAALVTPYMELTLHMEVIRKACCRQVAAEIQRRVGRKYLPELCHPRPIEKDVNRFIETDLQVVQLYELSQVLERFKSPDRTFIVTETWKNAVRAIGNAHTWVAAEPYIQSLLQSSTEKIRDAILQVIEGVRALRRNCFLIRDKAGTGKTNLLCRLAMDQSKAKICRLFLSCKFDLPQTRSLEDIIAGSLHAALEHLRDTGDEVPSLPQNPGNLMEEVFLAIHKGDAQLIVFLDAINENRDLHTLDEAIIHLLTKWNSMPVKFVVTCRDIFWSFFSEAQWFGFLFDGEAHELGEFDQHEVNEIIEAYFRVFDITGCLISTAREKCRHPLLLRFFCEAYQGRNIKEYEDLRLKDLFDEYWQRKQQDIAEALGLGNEGSMRVEAFLLKIVYHMFDCFATQVTLGELSAITGEADLDSDKSLYKRLLDQEIIWEELPPGDAFDRSVLARRISFVYEEFFDYMMALAYVRRADWDHRDSRQLCRDLVTLIRQSTSFEQLRGVVEYLVLLGEKKNVHQVFCATLARLANYQILCNVLPKLKGDTNWMDSVLRRCLLAISESRVSGTVKKATGWQPAYDEVDRLIRESEAPDLFKVLV